MYWSYATSLVQKNIVKCGIILAEICDIMLMPTAASMLEPVARHRPYTY